MAQPLNQDVQREPVVTTDSGLMACLEAVKREDEGSKIDESKTDEDKTSTAAAAG